MNNIKKFENFLESLKGKGQDTLIESIKSGFKVCTESIGDDEYIYPMSEKEAGEFLNSRGDRDTKKVYDKDGKEIGYACDPPQGKRIYNKDGVEVF